MKCTILGCGGSLGVPQLLCKCYVCKSTDQKNRRLRSSIYVESSTTKILVDTSPDFKEQAIKHGINKIDALLYTHAHADHISGIDDIKPIVLKAKKDLTVYLNEATLKSITGTYGYMFSSNSAVYRPLLSSCLLKDYSDFSVNDIKITSFLQKHGEINSMGFRFGSLAYSTDFNELSGKSMEALEGIDIWIIDCLRYGWAPTHIIYEQALEYIERIKPKRAILTHMAHDIEYNELKRLLPSHIEPAYDGMIVEFSSYVQNDFESYKISSNSS